MDELDLAIESWNTHRTGCRHAITSADTHRATCETAARLWAAIIRAAKAK